MPSNQLPFKRHHFNTLAQVHGQDVSDAILAMHQYQLMNEGISPSAVTAVFPEGPEGPLNEEMLIGTVLVNHTVWLSYD